MWRVVCALVAAAAVHGAAQFNSDYDGPDLDDYYDEAPSSLAPDALTRVRRYEDEVRKTLDPQDVDDIKGALKALFSGRKIDFKATRSSYLYVPARSTSSRITRSRNNIVNATDTPPESDLMATRSYVTRASAVLDKDWFRERPLLRDGTTTATTEEATTDAPTIPPTTTAPHAVTTSKEHEPTTSEGEEKHPETTPTTAEDDETTKKGEVSDTTRYGGTKGAETTDKDAGTTGKEGGTTDKEAETTDKDAGTTDKGGETTDKDAGTTDKEGETTDKDAGTTDKEGETTDKDAGTTDKEGETKHTKKTGAGTTKKLTHGNGTSSASNATAAHTKKTSASKRITTTVTETPTTTTEEPTTTTTTTKPTGPKFDIEALLAIVANMTYDYDTNLTQQLNETLQRFSIPTCGFPTTTTTSTTSETTTETWYNTTVVSKCFVCGMGVTGIPRNTFCADAFATDFLPLVPINPIAKGHISRYRKYCRYFDINNFQFNRSDPRAFLGRWTGGCAVRWIDLSGVYTQRTCRNRLRPATGKHYGSKRMAKLEHSLSHVDNGCVTSPMATLVPLSRGISLYARFHACVCTGNWCNGAVVVQQWIYNVWLLLLVLVEVVR